MSAHQAASNSKFVPGAPKKSSHDGQWQLAWLRALRLCSCRLPNTYPNDCCEVRFRSVELYDFGNTALESLFVADLFARRHVVRPLCCRNAILFSDVRLRRVCQPPSTSFHQYNYVSRKLQIEFFPTKYDWGSVHFIDTFQDARFEFMNRGGADMAEEGPGHFRAGSSTHLPSHETVLELGWRLLLEKK